MSYDPRSHLQSIPAFVHSVETGGFTAAAVRMGLSKSAVGKSVARLEERLGVKLLNRTTRRLSLTEEGQVYYASCLKVLDELGNAESFIASRYREVSGRLRINIPFSFGRLWIMPVLRDVIRQHPKLTLEVTFADRVVDLVEEGIDLVVRIGEAGDQTSLIRRKIGEQRWILCASPAYLATRGEPRTVEELRHHECIIFERDKRTTPWLLPDASGALVDARIEPRHIICHGEALRDAVLDGVGVAYMTTWLVSEDLRLGRLLPLLFDAPVNPAPIYALWHSSRELTPKVRVTVNALAQELQPTCPWDKGEG